MARTKSGPPTNPTPEEAWAYERAREWVDLAIRAGRIYYIAERSGSGMSGRVKVYVIVPAAAGERGGGDLVQFWPACERLRSATRFDYKRRSHSVGGCGFDRVHHVLWQSIPLALGLDDETARALANVSRESI